MSFSGESARRRRCRLGDVGRASAPALEAICLKAIEKEPTERYASAADLARDVQHWLADEPVGAHAEPTWTRSGPLGMHSIAP